MTTRYVMANIEMPIEIKPDNTIVPLQQLSNIRVVSIISSVNDIIVDKTIPDIITQTNSLLETSSESCNENETTNTQETDEIIEPPVVKIPQLWIHPDELRKKPLPFKKNSSFKNHSKYKHRTTAKKRESIDN